MNLTKKLIVVLMAVISVMLVGCSYIRPGDNGKINIVTTVFASYDFARQVAGDNANVTLLIKPGSESHSYEPTPYSVLERLIESEYIKAENVVVDYGCGKGRVDFFISYQTKANTIGIEYDERIYNSALENKKSYVSGRKVEFVLMDQTGKKTVYRCNEVDPRFWFAGEEISIEKIIELPDDAIGECTLYLNLPDGKDSLYDNPRFSIRLANDGTWDEETGYNLITEFKL